MLLTFVTFFFFLKNRYYTTFNEKPHQLLTFYQDESTLHHGVEESGEEKLENRLVAASGINVRFFSAFYNLYLI